MVLRSVSVLLVTRFEPFSRSEFSTRKSFETRSPCCVMADRTEWDPFFLHVFVLLASRFKPFSRSKSFQTRSPCCTMADGVSTECNRLQGSTHATQTYSTQRKQTAERDRPTQAGTHAGRHAGRDLTLLVCTSRRLRRRLGPAGSHRLTFKSNHVC